MASLTGPVAASDPYICELQLPIGSDHFSVRFARANFLVRTDNKLLIAILVGIGLA
jgi:hypothetical protein